jgi:hypothetical protein
MSSGIQLIYDSSQVGTLNSEKVMVAVPLLYMFMVLSNRYRPTIFFRSCG